MPWKPSVSTSLPDGTGALLVTCAQGTGPRTPGQIGVGCWCRHHGLGRPRAGTSPRAPSLVAYGSVTRQPNSSRGTDPLLRALRSLMLLAACTTAVHAQSLKVGDSAPDFTVTTVSKAGVDAAPFTLAAHRGEVVVLAFFPQAGTPGCTTQMEAYRDRYAALFKGGQKVTLVGVSTDDTDDLTGWARKKNFPFRFAADGNKTVGKAYGASGLLWHKRHLYVIDPQGRIAYIARPFNQMSEDAYAALGTAILAAAAGR